MKSMDLDNKKNSLLFQKVISDFEIGQEYKKKQIGKEQVAPTGAEVKGGEAAGLWVKKQKPDHIGRIHRKVSKEKLSPKSFYFSILKNYVANPKELMQFMDDKGIMQLQEEEKVEDPEEEDPAQQIKIHQTALQTVTSDQTISQEARLSGPARF